MVLRLTQKVAKKIKEQWPLEESPMDVEPLADWSSHLFTAGRSQYIVLCNTPTMYTCLFYGRGVTDFDRFIKRSLDAIREAFKDDNLGDVYQERVVPATARIGFAKAYSRSVTGCINDQIHSAKVLLEDHDWAPDQVAERLNDNIHSAFDYVNPRKAFRALCGKPEAPSNVLPFPGR
jgi:Domain of unknown function (DUF6933)